MKWWKFKALTAVLAVVGMVGCERHGIERVEWPTMGTIAAVQWRGTGNAEERKRVEEKVTEIFRKVVDEFNAFDEKSAINRLGKTTEFGKPCADFAERLKIESGGAFDVRWRKNGKLDYGAIAKGFAIDLAAAEVKGMIPMGDSLLIDLGGNLKAVNGDWNTGVKDGEKFVLRDGEACATSAKYYRGEHIRDARDGKNVGGEIHSVTIIHPTSAMAADGLSTVMFILGRERGEQFLQKFHKEAKAVWINAGL